MNEESAAADAGAAGPKRAPWRTIGVLMALALAGSFAMVPFQLKILSQVKPGGNDLPPAVLAFSVIVGILVELLISALAAAAGLWLGRRVGLGAPVIEGLLAGEPEAPRRFRDMVAPAIFLGGGLGVAIVGLAQLGKLLIPDLPAPAFKPEPADMILVSFGAGIREELWFRLGLMTLLAWLGVKLLRSTATPAAAIWSANVLVALVFGLAHLPLQAAVTGLSAPIVALNLSLNGIAGVAFGWLYWRRGVLAAMIAHFSADIVLHVIIPAVVGWATGGGGAGD